MKNTTLRSVSVLGLAVLAGACFEFERTGSVAGPSNGSTLSLLGNWASTSAGTFPTAESCSGLQWTITSETANGFAGDFHVTCAGGVTLDGTASGTINGSTITFQASGVANGLVPGSCNFTLSGTGYILTDAFQVDYTAMTCVGPLSGSETLKRK